MKAKARTFVLAMALLGTGCAYVRPPAQDRAVWEHQQKPKLTEGKKTFYEMIQGLWLGGNVLNRDASELLAIVAETCSQARPRHLFKFAKIEDSWIAAPYRDLCGKWSGGEI